MNSYKKLNKFASLCCTFLVFCTVFVPRATKTKIMNKLISFFVGLSLTFVCIDFAFSNSFPTEVSEWGTISTKTSAEHQFKTPFSSYDRLGAVSLDYCAAVVYTAPHDGELKIISTPAKEDLEIVVFRAESPKFATEISQGNAFLLAHKKLSKGQNLNVDIDEKNDLYESTRFQILKGQSILVFVNSKTETSIDFTPELKKVKTLEARTKVDPFEFRKNKAGKTLKIVVRDMRTGLPVKARLNVEGLKGIENVYSGSDFTFDLVTGKNAVLSCDAEGYFNNSVNPKLVSNVDNVVTILLTSFDINENMRLDGVQFREGTAEPLPSAFPDLDKLVDFMKTNPSITIEVQGHVNAPDGNSRAAEKLSLMRAKYVRDYLIKNGVDKDRVEFEGYGASMMIYEDPKTDDEEQANRRVEIKIYQ